MVVNMANAVDYTITKRKDFTEVLELINSNKDKNIIAGCQSITGVNHGMRLVRNGALPRVVGFLRSSSFSVRAAAVSAVGWIAGEDSNRMLLLKEGALRPLVELLRVSADECRADAALAIGNIAGNEDSALVLSNEHVLEELLPLLDSPHPTLQANVAFAVGNFASNVGITLDDRTAERLIALLKNENEAVQEYCAYSLKQLCDPRGRSGGEMISKLVTLGVVPPLLELIHSNSQWVLSEALAALQYIATQSPKARPRIALRTPIRRLIGLLSSHYSECRLLSLKTLKALAPCASSSIVMAEEGVLTALVPYITSDLAKHQKISVDIAYHLAKIPENARAFLVSGSIPLILNQGPLLKHLNRHVQHHNRLRSWVISLVNHSQNPLKTDVIVALTYTLAAGGCPGPLQQLLWANNGLDVLFSVLKTSKDTKAVRAAAMALERTITAATSEDLVRPFFDNGMSPLPNHKRLFGSEKFSDVIFEIMDPSAYDGASYPQFPSHKAVLWQNSVYFRAMMDSGMRENDLQTIPVTDTQYSVFMNMMQFIYTGKTDINNSTVCDLLIAANRYLITALKYQCEEYLIMKQLGLGEEKRGVDTVAAAAQSLLLADATQAGELSRACVRHLLKNFEGLVDNITCGPEGLEPVYNAMYSYLSSLKSVIEKMPVK